jgi:hypothetical protein
MNGRYRTKLAWRILIFVTGPGLIGLFGFLLVILIKGADEHPGALIFLGSVSLAMIGLMLYGIVDSIIGYYEIGDDFVAQHTMFGTKTVPLSDIKGVMTDKNYTILVPKPGKKGLKISKYLQKYDEITWWAYTNFEDLGTQKADEEDVEVLKEVTREVPASEHDHRLKKAKTVSKYLNLAGYGVGFWTLFYPHPYDFAVLASMVVPIIIIIAIWHFKGFLRYNGQDKSRYPVMTGPLLLPVAALVLRMLFDFEVLDYGNLWSMAAAIAVGLVVTAMWTSNEFSVRSWVSGFTVSFYTIAFYGYAIGSLVIINCYFDASAYETYAAEILGKEVSSGKSTTYYLDLSPWGPRTVHERVSVGHNAFDRANVGDTVEVHVFEGRLKAKWFEIEIE